MILLKEKLMGITFDVDDTKKVYKPAYYDTF